MVKEAHPEPVLLDQHRVFAELSRNLLSARKWSDRVVLYDIGHELENEET